MLKKKAPWYRWFYLFHIDNISYSDQPKSKAGQILAAIVGPVVSVVAIRFVVYLIGIGIAMGTVVGTLFAGFAGAIAAALFIGSLPLGGISRRFETA